MRRQDVDCCLLDILMPGMDGIEVLACIKRLDATIEVVLVTAVRTLRTAVEAMRLGAYDYLTKPFPMEELRGAVHGALERRALRREARYLREGPAWHEGLDELIGGSAAMRRVYELIAQVARTTATVLVSGESGTGKELIARAIHRQGPRRDGPFVAVNCGALPSELLESELFGHVRGAFTGAVRDRVGRFEMASKGTLFLDEIGDLPMPLQVKLLRVLQERTYERVGESAPRTTNARIIAATNIDLRRALAQGRFREDLFYRLCVVPIEIPPLRERREDIAALANHLLVNVTSQHNLVKRLSPQ